MAATIVCRLEVSVRSREAVWEDQKSNRRKVFQYVSLFCFLVVIYAIYLSMHLKAVTAAEQDQLPLVKLCFISALPFAVLAYSDENWDSNDAAPICGGAWVAVGVGFSYKCAICAVGLAFAFFPFILAALLSHGLGTLCRLVKERIKRRAI
jgi:dipeptide/tripeptide permease